MIYFTRNYKILITTRNYFPNKSKNYNEYNYFKHQTKVKKYKIIVACITILFTMTSVINYIDNPEQLVHRAP